MFEDQIACADLVILSKSDLHGRRRRAPRANAIIGEHLPRAVKIVPTSHGKVDPSVLLGLGLAVEDDIENRKTHHDDELDHEHDDFDSFIVELPPIASPDDLAARVSARRRERERAAREGLRRGRRQADAAAACRPSAPRVNHYYDRAWTRRRRPPLAPRGDRPRGLDRAARIEHDPRARPEVSDTAPPCTS